MLALTRKKGESIVINENIEIFIIEASKDTVKLGIKAPKEISIYRKEIFEQIMKENRNSILEIDINEMKKYLGNS